MKRILSLLVAVTLIGATSAAASSPIQKAIEELRFLNSVGEFPESDLAQIQSNLLPLAQAGSQEAQVLLNVVAHKLGQTVVSHSATQSETVAVAAASVLEDTVEGLTRGAQAAMIASDGIFVIQTEAATATPAFEVLQKNAQEAVANGQIVAKNVASQVQEEVIQNAITLGNHAQNALAQGKVALESARVAAANGYNSLQTYVGNALVAAKATAQDAIARAKATNVRELIQNPESTLEAIKTAVKERPVGTALGALVGFYAGYQFAKPVLKRSTPAPELLKGIECEPISYAQRAAQLISATILGTAGAVAGNILESYVRF